MENTNSIELDELKTRLAQQVNNHRAQLVAQYQNVLRETLFTNRATVRPKILSEIAADELDALHNYLHLELVANMRGIQLCDLGLSEQSVLHLIQVTRQFFLTRAENGSLASILEIVDAYQNDVIRGYVKRFEEIILEEQERIRSALQIAISRYTVEIREVQQLAQRETEASEFKSRFMARISHELRTPLGALLGMADMLQYDVYGPLSPQQKDITQRIMKNALMLERVFSELLDQSQIESGQLRLKEDIFSPQSMVQAVYSNYLSMALDKNISLTQKLDPEIPERIIGDRIRIEQVLSNLVTNAIKFTQTGGVDIHVFLKEDSHWALQVKDTGMGISETDQVHIFEPFRQSDESIKREYGGVGLGLSIVKQLVAAMNGTVSLESKLGKGSTFTVILPLQEAQ